MYIYYTHIVKSLRYIKAFDICNTYMRCVYNGLWFFNPIISLINIWCVIFTKTHKCKSYKIKYNILLYIRHFLYYNYKLMSIKIIVNMWKYPGNQCYVLVL